MRLLSLLMEKHIKQAKHNKSLLEHLIITFPNTYSDWKVTLCFYTAVHYMRALVVKHGGDVVDSHEQIKRMMCPRSSDKICTIKQDQWDNYHGLKVYSETARYNGILDIDDHEEVSSNNLKDALVMLGRFEKYVEKITTPKVEEEKEPSVQKKQYKAK